MENNNIDENLNIENEKKKLDEALLKEDTIQKNEINETKQNHPSGFFTLQFKDGSTFDGQLKNGEIDSFGILENINEKIKFQGLFDKFNEKQIGKLIFDDGKIIYEGEFYKGKFAGKGELRYSNGDKYIGSFKEGLRNGEGILYFKEGDIYEGNFLKGNFEGEGKLIIKDVSEYRGNFKNGKYNGYGMLISLNNGEIIMGNFIDGIINGNGIQYFSNKDIYEGNFINGK